jgi:hypothetical protein
MEAGAADLADFMGRLLVGSGSLAGGDDRSTPVSWARFNPSSFVIPAKARTPWGKVLLAPGPLPGLDPTPG